MHLSLGRNIQALEIGSGMIVLEHQAPSLWSDSTDCYLSGLCACWVLCITLCQYPLLAYFMTGPLVCRSLMWYFISSFFPISHKSESLESHRSVDDGLAPGRIQREKRRSYKDLLQEEDETATQVETLREKVSGCMDMHKGSDGMGFFSFFLICFLCRNVCRRQQEQVIMSCIVQ